MKNIFIPLIISVFSGNISAQDLAMNTILSVESSAVVVDTLKSPDIELEAKREMIQRVEIAEPESLAKNQKKTKGDEAYQYVAYQKAADLYTEVQNRKGKMTREMMVHMAEANRLNGHTEEAEYWYARFVQGTSDANMVFNYAQVLQSNGKCEDAIRWYAKYQAMREDQENISFIEDCEELNAFAKNKNVKIKNIEALNSEAIDFSPVPYQDGVIFTSTRVLEKQIYRRDAWTKEDFSDLYFAEQLGEDLYKTPIAIEGSLNSKYHDGTATFHPNGTQMIFTRSSSTGKDQQNIVNLKLLVTNKKGEKWSKPQELPFNSDDFNTAHPSFSQDGQLLFFASDRPDGFGGMDIYLSEYKDGQWQLPINAGPAVNTAGNEIFPFIDAENTLFFASNGHKGLGGLDIFKVEQTTEGDLYSWNDRENLGKRYNTPKDDFAYVSMVGGEKGYLSSNRSGGRGADDIYSWKKEEEAPLSQNLVIVDEGTNERIANANLTILRKKKNKKVAKDVMDSDAEGGLKYLIDKEEVYEIIVQKDGYELKTIEVKAKDMLKEDVYKVLMKKRILTMRGIVTEQGNSTIIPNANLVLLNKCTGEEERLVSDVAGKFTYNLNCNCEYELRGSKDQYVAGNKIFNTKDLDCINTNFVDEKLELALSSNSILDTYEVGQVITLEDVYYDFDKFNIRSDASVELDRVVNLLNKYQTMKLELHSHTDARGSSRYNQRLSQKRAESAVNYIISRGIVAERITAIGFGETELLNRCKNGVKCTDEEHQENRRTEILITEFNEPNVKVRNKRH